MRSFQKISFSVLLCGVLGVSSLLFIPTEAFSALPKKKLEIIIGGENFCKDDKDCAGDSFCHMTSHICISCPTPFEWVGGTQCVCPDGTVPTADGKDCVECLDDSNCTTLKGSTSWYCDTETNTCINCPAPKEWHFDTNTCECPSGLHEVGGECECDNPKKTPNEDGNCICQLDQADCPTSDFTNAEQCACCPADKPVWDEETKQCVEDTCYGRMIAAGFDDKLFKISGELITYNGDMTVSQDLDISKCDLMVKGILAISNGTTSVRNVEVSNSERNYGIILSADTTLTVGGNVISTLRNAETAASGIDVSSNSTITARGDITATVSSSYNGQLQGIFSRGTITTQGDITATVSSSYGGQLSGINSSGTITAQGDITATVSSSYGGQLSGINSSGIITAQGDIIGKSNSTEGGNQNEGIILSSGTITAHGNITGTAKGGNGLQLIGIDVKKGATLITIAGNVIGQSNATDGTQNEGIMLRGGTITAHGDITATAMGKYGSQINGINAFNESTITAYGNITATAKGGGDLIMGISASDKSIITSENGTITGDSWSEYGNNLCGIYLLKEATIIAEMGNIKGTAKGVGTALEGVAAHSGSIRAEGDIVGKTTKTEGSYDVSVYSDASMVAKNIYYCNEIRGEVQGNKIQKCL